MKASPRKLPNREKSKTYNILISGAAGNGNIGDEVLPIAIIQALKDEIPNANFTILCIDPEYIRERYQVEAVGGNLKKSWHRLLRVCREADLFIVGGGVSKIRSAELRSGSKPVRTTTVVAPTTGGTTCGGTHSTESVAQPHILRFQTDFKGTPIMKTITTLQ